jgi:hypothetical protein
MIDRPEHVERLMAKLNAALPIAARIPPNSRQRYTRGLTVWRSRRTAR